MPTVGDIIEVSNMSALLADTYLPTTITGEFVITGLPSTLFWKLIGIDGVKYLVYKSSFNYGSINTIESITKVT